MLELLSAHAVDLAVGAVVAATAAAVKLLSKKD